VEYAEEVCEDHEFSAIGVTVVTMAELCRRKALADRKAKMAAEGLSPVDDNDNDPCTMTFTNADGTKTASYTLSDGAQFFKNGPWIQTLVSYEPMGQTLCCSYVASEVIAERTEHRVGDTVEYELPTHEVTSTYQLSRPWKSGFSPVTLESSVTNSASLSGENVITYAGPVPATDPGGAGEVAPIIKQAEQMVLDVAKNSKGRSLPEAVLAIIEAKRQAKELLNNEIEKLEHQKTEEFNKGEGLEGCYQIATHTTPRLMHLDGALNAIEKIYTYEKGFQDGKQWMLDPNRGPGPALVLNFGYIQGFEDGVRSVVRDPRFKQGLQEGVQAFKYGKQPSGNGEAYHDVGVAVGFAAAQRQRQQDPSLLERLSDFLKGTVDSLKNALDWIWGGTANTGGGNTETRGNRDISFDPQQVQSKFKHAPDFGIQRNYNPQNAALFEQKIQNFVNKAPNQIPGTYRGEPANFYVDPQSGLMVMTKPSGEFWSAWKLGEKQLQNLLQKGTLR
jgi:hypothetical protein